MCVLLSEGSISGSNYTHYNHGVLCAGVCCEQVWWRSWLYISILEHAACQQCGCGCWCRTDINIEYLLYIHTASCVERCSCAEWCVVCGSWGCVVCRGVLCVGAGGVLCAERCVVCAWDLRVCCVCCVYRVLGCYLYIRMYNMWSYVLILYYLCRGVLCAEVCCVQGCAVCRGVL
jgi:hypothetical protein